MSQLPQRSLKYEYELFVEDEIENYKLSIPRSALLSIADEAVEVIEAQDQLALTEIVLWEEVDRIIRRRLRIPTYASWLRRRTRLRESYRSPERCGLRSDDFLVREIPPASDGHVLIAGAPEEGKALYFAAHGSEVVAVNQQPDAIERVMLAASNAGLTERVRGCVSALGDWTPDVPLGVVICDVAALGNLTNRERARAIDQLQRATLVGGVHLVRLVVEAGSKRSLTMEELRTRYDGWAISEELSEGGVSAILARKQLS